jgi:hypothetical protein
MNNINHNFRPTSPAVRVPETARKLGITSVWHEKPVGVIDWRTVALFVLNGTCGCLLADLDPFFQVIALMMISTNTMMEGSGYIVLEPEAAEAMVELLPSDSPAFSGLHLPADTSRVFIHAFGMHQTFVSWALMSDNIALEKLGAKS